MRRSLILPSRELRWLAASILAVGMVPGTVAAHTSARLPGASSTAFTTTIAPQDRDVIAEVTRRLVQTKRRDLLVSEAPARARTLVILIGPGERVERDTVVLSSRSGSSADALLRAVFPEVKAKEYGGHGVENVSIPNRREPLRVVYGLHPKSRT